jgi:hypothetical protein
VLCADLAADEADTAEGLRRQVWQAQGDFFMLLTYFARSCNMVSLPLREAIQVG